MKDIQRFVEIHRRIQGTPPEMEAALQDVWKKLQLFSAEDPLSFYELAVCFTFPKAHVPGRPWRTRIIDAGFASLAKTGGKPDFIIHDMIDIIFREHLLEKPETKSVPPPAPAPPAAPAEPPAPPSTRVRKKNGKKP